MEWIGCTVCEIFAFKLHCDLETGVRAFAVTQVIESGTRTYDIVIVYLL